MRIGNSLRTSVRLLEAVADENRIRILKCLQVRPACVCELVQALDMPQPRASRHLKVLRDAGLVDDTRDAQWVEYSLVQAEDGSPEPALLALVAGWLEDDPAILEDRRRYAQASRDGCCPPRPDRRPRVLFLCTGNSCRSQMAEGLLRHLAGDRYEVASAGTVPSAQVFPPAIQAMAEIGIDISGGVPKSVDDLPDASFDVVITVCDNANENCPYLPGKFERLHWPFDDPAAVEGSEDEKLAACRRVRDEIRDKLAAWLASM